MFDELRVAKYRFTLQAGERGLELPAWKASTFRGAFGHVFKRLSCINPGEDCGACSALTYCAYPYIFETRPNHEESFMGGYEQVPRPYILEVPTDKQTIYEPGDLLSVNLLLFGKAIHYAPLFVSTFKELGEQGIGRGRKGYRLVHVENRDMKMGNHRTMFLNEENVTFHSPIVLTGRDIWEGAKSQAPEQGRLMVFFETPLRIKSQGIYSDNPSFPLLIRNILRRMTGLLQFHHDITPKWDIKNLILKSEQIQLVRKEVKWVDYDRYSARQDSKMKMGGIVGWAQYEGEVGEFLPWLRVAEIIHIGKNTVFDLGRTRVTVHH
ncbi:CRISPR system precrRNA processing endoribonuclease RAMP protein Cas6 [Fodinisporobacter ferrooxydans]|uniref:CRISPR system precrRNA processing endoribonuclease RAMP protein Cas6 n=1 Tax=Fodinisporobacter ferrooxydans TaxID=2901836 RepID=A0ABY4CJJ6_9BACL|nr:CRISPR system precrRNA processing endoribonuclease RAMP protein Cas6 [Alicyclobacillaceae bacterium MYW30-H2]